MSVHSFKVPKKYKKGTGAESEVFLNVTLGFVSVCGNTMCYLNYREAEVQVLKRT